MCGAITTWRLFGQSRVGHLKCVRRTFLRVQKSAGEWPFGVSFARKNKVRVSVCVCMTVIALFPSSSHFIFEKFALPPWLKEEFVDLMAGAAGVISSVEDLVRHTIWSVLDTTHVQNRSYGTECI